MAAASALISAGRTPTVAEAADAAGVSRRTAYRYFPTQAKLVTEAALEGLRLPMEAEWIDLSTREIRKAYVFVAGLGFSQLLFAWAAEDTRSRN